MRHKRGQVAPRQPVSGRMAEGDKNWESNGQRFSVLLQRRGNIDDKDVDVIADFCKSKPTQGIDMYKLALDELQAAKNGTKKAVYVRHVTDPNRPIIGFAVFHTKETTIERPKDDEIKQEFGNVSSEWKQLYYALRDNKWLPKGKTVRSFVDECMRIIDNERDVLASLNEEDEDYDEDYEKNKRILGHSTYLKMVVFGDYRLESSIQTIIEFLLDYAAEHFLGEVRDEDDFNNEDEMEIERAFVCKLDLVCGSKDWQGYGILNGVLKYLQAYTRIAAEDAKTDTAYIRLYAVEERVGIYLKFGFTKKYPERKDDLNYTSRNIRDKKGLLLNSEFPAVGTVYAQPIEGAGWTYNGNEFDIGKTLVSKLTDVDKEKMARYCDRGDLYGMATKKFVSMTKQPKDRQIAIVVPHNSGNIIAFAIYDIRIHMQDAHVYTKQLPFSICTLKLICSDPMWNGNKIGRNLIRFLADEVVRFHEDAIKNDGPMPEWSASSFGAYIELTPNNQVTESMYMKFGFDANTRGPGLILTSPNLYRIKEKGGQFPKECC